MSDTAICVLSGSLMVCLTIGTFGWLINEKLYMLWRETHEHYERYRAFEKRI